MVKSKIAFLGLFIFFILIIVFNSSISAIVFFGLFSLCLYFGYKEKNGFNPYYLFSITPLTLVLYTFEKNSFYLKSIDLLSYSVIFLGVLSFILGLRYSKRYSRHPRVVVFRKDSLSRIFWISLILGFIPHLIGLSRVGIPILNLNTLEETRMMYLPQGLSYFVFFLPLTIIISFASENKKWIILSLIVNIFFSVIRVAKFDFFIFIFFFLFSFYKYGSKIFPLLNRKFLLLLFVFLIPFIFDYTYLLKNGIGLSGSKFLIEGFSSTSSFQYLVSLPFFYLSTPWSNFAHNFSTINDFNFGLYSLHPFLSALQIGDLFEFTSYKTAYMHPFNTFAFLTDFYMDFGVLGVIVLPFVLGYFVFSVYRKSRINTNPIIDGQFLITAIPTFFLFFSNHFTSVGYPIIVYLLFGMLLYFSRKVIRKI